MQTRPSSDPLLHKGGKNAKQCIYIAPGRCPGGKRGGWGSGEEEGGREVSDPAWHISVSGPQTTCLRSPGKPSNADPWAQPSPALGNPVTVGGQEQHLALLTSPLLPLELPEACGPRT